MDKYIDIISRFPNEEIESLCRLGDWTTSQISAYNSILKKNDKQMSKFRMNYPRFVEESCKFVTEYSEEIESFLSGERIYPLIVEIHPGVSCNLNCIFCFSKGDQYNDREKVDLITVGAFRKLCYDLKENDVREIWFSGGKEPLMNPNSLLFIEIANSFGFITRLYTNGLLLDQDASCLSRMQQIRISVNAANGETYCKICGLKDKGQFGDLLSKIRQLVNRKRSEGKNFRTKLCVSFLIQEMNYHEMTDFYNLMSNIGVDSIQYRLDSIGRVGKLSDSIRDEIIKQAGDIIYGASKCGDPMPSLRGIIEREFENDLLPGLSRPKICMAGMVKRGISPIGDVFFCEYSSHPHFARENNGLKLGNMIKEPFSEIMKRAAGKFPPVCEHCQAHEYGLNVLFEKLVADKNFGFNLKDQIFYRGL